MIKYKLITLVLMTLSVWFTGCDSSNNNSDNMNSHIVSLMSDKNLSVSNIHSVYRNENKDIGNINEVKLMRTNGQNQYKNDIAFALTIRCNTDCENYTYRMYIDSDHNIESGYEIDGIGSDIRIGSDGYYRWLHNAWIPDIQIYQYEYILDTIGTQQLVIVTHVGTNNLFKISTKIVMTAGSNLLDPMQTPVILVTDF